MDTFTTAYIEAALWSSTYGDEHNMDDGEHELAPETLATMIADCASFQKVHADLLVEADQGDEYNGHDFWLTRCGHGAGFWDRGLGPVGDKLTDAAQAYGNVELYVGDDGLIYA